jgi:hypothetical protein
VVLLMRCLTDSATSQRIPETYYRYARPSVQWRGPSNTSVSGLPYDVPGPAYFIGLCGHRFVEKFFLVFRFRRPHQR